MPKILFYLKASLSSTCGPTTTTTIPTTTTGFSVNDAIAVGCSDIGWNIRVDISRLRQTLPGIRTSDIYLGENSCIGLEENGALYFRQGLRECLTSETIINDAMVYTNELVYAQHDPVYSFVIRQFNWTVAVECDVMNNESATGEYHHAIAKPSIAPVSGAGHHSVNLTFYQDANFLSPLPGNPIHLPTGTDVYVKVFTLSSDWTVKMHVHTCYTRPINVLSDDQNYFLIQNGCEMDANTHILSQTAHETRFVFKDFVYTSDGAGIKVKCDVTFCDSHDVSRQCTQTCN
ncbi:CUB and zona pellucida-like domain-containing protein 1 [Mya arenaria]|uniref:CUB and zona pellucida-like domain-containing protein 1 n=1 Tax=Mya arenaria TaxID=6604 RepID=UPI0022E0814F|nr:CUB and zona pellucida-like domain-containing protein 1 [Mya arenaria]